MGKDQFLPGAREFLDSIPDRDMIIFLGGFLKCHRADTAVHIIAAVTTVHTARHIIRAAGVVQAAAGVIRRAITAHRILLRAAAIGVIHRCEGRALRSRTDGIQTCMVK